MALSGAQYGDGANLTLLDTTTITAAVTGTTTTPVTDLDGTKYIGVIGVFTYGSGGTTLKVWLQTTFDNGTTWVDVLNFAFTTASLTKVGSVAAYIGLTPATNTDATLADNTANQGLIGDQIRLKYTSTGIYAASTTIKVSAVVKG